MLGDPLHDPITLLNGCRGLRFGRYAVIGEDDGGFGSNHEFPDQPVRRMMVAKHPPGAMDVDDDGERCRGIRWPQDVNGDLTAFYREIGHVNQRVARLARLHLSKGGATLFGSKVSQKWRLRDGFCERLGLRL